MCEPWLVGRGRGKHTTPHSRGPSPGVLATESPSPAGPDTVDSCRTEQSVRRRTAVPLGKIYWGSQGEAVSLDPVYSNIQ